MGPGPARAKSGRSRGRGSVEGRAVGACEGGGSGSAQSGTGARRGLGATPVRPRRRPRSERARGASATALLRGPEATGPPASTGGAGRRAFPPGRRSCSRNRTPHPRRDGREDRRAAEGIRRESCGGPAAEKARAALLTPWRKRHGASVFQTRKRHEGENRENTCPEVPDVTWEEQSSAMGRGTRDPALDNSPGSCQAGGVRRKNRRRSPVHLRGFRISASRQAGRCPVLAGRPVERPSARGWRPFRYTRRSDNTSDL
ncbi:hypothetical protein SAMN02745673_00373 [Marinactinospora thermotolerans DSM 45154]|uniref:Uncharacterized protein n=1 Tax=Marinactinospora thermotolerans DSM 45154 TaxID=1122192 RepID=A0A1T4KH31_9ACTN|nr:hypothetical protein SAMN02745673_00373 [Marinactinospora thermotolerans DSM 45154]